MFGSTFALAIGLMCIAIVRFSADRASVGVVAVLGIVLVATGCALHTAAILHEVALPPLVRGLATAISWATWTIAVVWLLRFVDPRPEVLLAVLLIPAALGVAGLLVSQANRGWAAAFLTEAVALVALLGPVFLQRMAA